MSADSKTPSYIHTLETALVRANARIAELEKENLEHIAYGQDQQRQWRATGCKSRIAELEARLK